MKMSVPSNQPSHIRQFISQLSRFTAYIIKRKDTGQEEGFAFLDRNYETIPCLEEWQLELFAEVEKDKSEDVEPFQLSGPSVFSTPSIKLPPTLSITPCINTSQLLPTNFSPPLNLPPTLSITPVTASQLFPTNFSSAPPALSIASCVSVKPPLLSSPDVQVALSTLLLEEATIGIRKSGETK